MKIWDARTGNELKTLVEIQGISWILRFSPDGSVLAVARTNARGGQPSEIYLWKVGTWKQHAILHHSVGIVQFDFWKDGRRLFSGEPGAVVRLWDVATGKEMQPLTGPVGTVNTVLFGRRDPCMRQAATEKPACGT